jgi:hypothetical protein
MEKDTHTHTHTQQEVSRHRLKVISLSILSIAIVFSAYLFGAYSYPRNIWPLDLLRKIKQSTPLASTSGLGDYDAFGRLTTYPNKSQVNCPTQTDETAVLLVIGQSNSANHAEKKYTTENPTKVFNYYKGKCYVASSPLLGATGEEGEFITPLADKLIANGTYKSVVIISSGIGGTPISRWQKDGDLNEMLLETLEEVKSKYEINNIVWHQGESDFISTTSAKVYANSFHSLINTIEKKGVKALTYIAVATKCGFNATWTNDNPTAIGQKSLIDNKNIFLGANTDTLLENIDRNDGCHFSQSGQNKTSTAFSEAIAKSKKSN